MEPLSKSKFQSPAFLSFIREIQRHLQQTKKEQLCIETSKYHYNLPSDVKIYSLEEVSDKYNEFYEK